MSDAEVLVRLEATAKGLLAEVQRARAALSPGVTGAAGQARAALDDVGRTGAAAGQAAANGLADLPRAANSAAGAIADLKRELSGLVSLATIGQALRTSIDAMRVAESAFRGLESAAQFSGVGIQRAFEEAGKLSADGLLTVAEASKSLQNLLARGYDLDDAVAVIERLKDAAAFGRQAQLGLGEAVQTATEGLKSENSVLVDNAGVTKNVAKMWEEYAASIGVSAANLTQQQKVAAEVNGIMAETAAQVGNAAKAADGLEGALARMNAQTNEVQVAFGTALLPVTMTLTEAGTTLARVFGHILAAVENMPKVFGFATVSMEQIKRSILDGDWDQIDDRIGANLRLLQEEIAETNRRYREGYSPAMQAATQAGRETAASIAAVTEQHQRQAVAASASAAASKEAARAEQQAAKDRERALAQYEARRQAVEQEFAGYGQDQGDAGSEPPAYLDIWMQQAEALRSMVEGDARAAMDRAREAGRMLDEYARQQPAGSELARTQIAGLREAIKGISTEAQAALDAPLLNQPIIDPAAVQEQAAQARLTIETVIGGQPVPFALAISDAALAAIRAGVEAAVATWDITVPVRPVLAGGGDLADAAASRGQRP